MESMGGESERSERENIDSYQGDESLISRPPLDPSYNRPGDDSGPPRFRPQTSEFTMVDFLDHGFMIDFSEYGLSLWRDGDGCLYVTAG